MAAKRKILQNVNLPIRVVCRDAHRPEQTPKGRLVGKKVELVGSRGFFLANFLDLLDRVAQEQLNLTLLLARDASLKEGCRL
jgi:hypothetical protein